MVLLARMAQDWPWRIEVLDLLSLDLSGGQVFIQIWCSASWLRVEKLLLWVA